MSEYRIYLRHPHPGQQRFIDSPAKRKIIRAGRRGGKTTGIAIWAVQRFLLGRRVLYAAPTADQIGKFWWEVTQALREPLAANVLYKNETGHIVERPNSENRIRAKTAWNADTLRGDYADDLILDEWQLMAEETWELVGAPMLMDHNGDAVFIYTPLSLASKHRTKARDPRHAAKLYKKAEADESGRWAAFHFTSHDNPHISKEALAEITFDMTQLAIEQEILAEDKDEAPGALWNNALIAANRIGINDVPPLSRIVVGVDPPGGATECGIVIAGIGYNGHGYVLADYSTQSTPQGWAGAVVSAYEFYQADRVVGEANYGGDMVENTIRTVEGGAAVSYKDVHASRGKALRAEPVAAFYERGMVHHAGEFPHLETEQCTWQPGSGMKSPNRLDGLVWALTDLMLEDAQMETGHNPLAGYRG